LCKRNDARLRFGVIRGDCHEYADAACPIRLLRARHQWPRGRRAADERDEVASFQLIELHPVPASQGRIAGYRIASDQSAGSWGDRAEAIAPAEVGAAGATGIVMRRTGRPTRAKHYREMVVDP